MGECTVARGLSGINTTSAVNAVEVFSLVIPGCEIAIAELPIGTVALLQR
jgi:hypothetical protein